MTCFVAKHLKLDSSWSKLSLSMWKAGADPGGGCRGSGPPPPIRCHFLTGWFFYKMHIAPCHWTKLQEYSTPMICLCLISHANGDWLSKIWETCGHLCENRIETKNCNHFSRTFQGPNKIFKDHLLARNYTISQNVLKCTFPVYSNKALRLELFASPASLHFSVHLS